MKKDWFLVVYGALAAGGVMVAAVIPNSIYVASEVQDLQIEPASLSVLFVGDIMLDRSVAKHAEENGEEVLFKAVENLLAGQTIVVGNFEGTITDNESLSQKDHTILRFTASPKSAELLQNTGFTAMSLANNHASDFYTKGYQETIEYLSDAGIISFGSPFNTERLSAQIATRGVTLCFVGYHELFRRDPTSVLNEIEDIRPACTYLVVMSHWGEEYRHEATASQRELAHAFIDAGADVIIGSHPHVVEPVEIYKNKAIFYSLGNFLFDQAFRPEVKRGLAVRVEFLPTKIRFTLTPVNTYLEARVADATTAEAVLIEAESPRSFELER